MFWYNLRAARQLDSELMRANAWHHRSDALSSVGVALGIGAATLGGASWRVGKMLWGVVVF